MDVDWEKPIEAVHEDGRVIAARFLGRVAGDGSVWVSGFFDDGNGHWFSQKGWASHTPYRIRNVQPAAAKPAISDELVERMVALVRDMAEQSSDVIEEYKYSNKGIGDDYHEAAAIVADLPHPPNQIDPDVEEATRIVADSIFRPDKMSYSNTLVVAAGRTDDLRNVLNGIKRGRALERGEP